MKYMIAVVLILTSFSSLSAKNKSISVPSDSKASYIVLETGKQSGMRTIVTERTGPSGTSYSKRIYDCKNKKVKYLGDGETLADMKKSTPDASMYDIVPGSIADYIGIEACK